MDVQVPDVQVPVGTVLAYAGLETTIPPLKAKGWLLCDGSTLTRADYSELFDAIGTSFGGDGNSFYLPDLRGLFLRGVSGTSDNDPDASSRTPQHLGGHTGNAVGTVQQDEFKGHKHTWRGWWNTTYGDEDRPARARNFMPDDPTDDAADVAGGAETRPKNVYVYYIIKYTMMYNPKGNDEGNADQQPGAAGAPARMGSTGD